MKDKHDRQHHQDNAAADTKRHSASSADRESRDKEPDARNATSAGHGSKDEAKERQFRKRITILSIVFSGLLLIATTVYAWFAGGQWQAMDATLGEIKRNRIVEHRAYVLVKSIRFTARPNDPTIGDVVVTTFNSGRTPAVGTVMARLGVFEDSPPDDTPIPPPKESPSRIVFAPNVDLETAAGAFPTTNPPLPQGTPASAGTPQKRATPVPTPTPTPTPVPTPPPDSKIGIYILGRIDYVDIFGKPRWTKFCFVNTPGTKDWKFCPTFNATDQSEAETK